MHILDYWQIKHAFFFCSEFWLVISHDRFKQIHRYLHFSNEEEAVPKGEAEEEAVPKGEAGYDPLFKIRKLLDLIVPKFQSLYEPDQNMIPR